MQSSSLIIAAVLLMVALNVAMILATVGAKVLRGVSARRLAERKKRLEPPLYDFLATGEIPRVLWQAKGEDREVLSALIVELLVTLRGADRERVVGLASELGMVRRDLNRLRSRRRWRRARAAENLGFFGSPEVVPRLAELLSDEDETLRAVAARALARIGTPEAAAILAGTLNDPSELTRLRMAENLERIGLLATNPLLAALEGGIPPARVLAARVLGNLRAFQTRPALREAMLAGSFDDLRAQAALALGRVGDPEDIPALLEASADESWPVRAQVANALGMIGDVATIPTLQKLTVDEEWWVRLNASRALANMGPVGEQALASILEGEDRFARDRAAATLEERGILRRAASELTSPGERGESARAMVQAMVRVGAVRYLTRLATTLPDEGARDALRRIMVEASEP
jgi:HEAT repeat protein